MAREVLYTLEEQVDPKHTALIVIDMQNDFCHPDGYMGKCGFDVSASQAIVPRLAGHIEATRRAGATVVFIQLIMDDMYRYANFLAHDHKRGVSLERCQTASWGADFYELKMLPSDLLVIKHHYSAFVDTNLDLVLKSRGIKTIVMSGTATNVCVESTARDGFFNGYYVVFLSDCSATYSQEVHDATLANIDRHFGAVITADEVEASWEKNVQR